MDVDTLNMIIVWCVIAVTAIALLLALMYFVKDKLCGRGDYDPVKKTSSIPPPPRNTPAQQSVISRQHQAAVYQPGQKTHDVDGLAFIDDKGAPAVVSATVMTSKSIRRSGSVEVGRLVCANVVVAMDMYAMNYIIIVCTVCVFVCALLLGLAHYLCFGRLLAEQLDKKTQRHTRIIGAPAELEPIALQDNP
uniref:Uncharacterized protein n=1 Tax=Plectus sambesii TaxID=2011161 RepID=A0A914X242_9BILA